MCEDGIISVTYISVVSAVRFMWESSVYLDESHFPERFAELYSGRMNLQRCVAEYFLSAMREDVVPMLPALCFGEALSAASLCTVALF